jgi:LPS sulfotransferase NodH
MTTLPDRTLVICTQPRSGSNFLGALIGLSGELPAAQEWLNPPTMRLEAIRLGLPFDVASAPYLLALGPDQRNSTGFFSLKVMGYQMQALLEDLKDSALTLKDLFPSARFLYLRREDCVAQAVSHARALQTQHWTQEDDGVDAPVPVYSYLHITRLLETIEESEQFWEGFFTQFGIEPFRLHYEDLAQDPVAEIEAIHRWLDLPPPADTQAIRERSRRGRQATSSNLRWKERFQAERSRFPTPDAVPNFPEGAFEISLDATTEQLTPMQPAQIKAHIRNTGSEPWLGTTLASGSHEQLVWIRGDLSGHAGPIAGYPFIYQEVPSPLAPGEAITVDVHLPALEGVGAHHVHLSICQSRGERLFLVAPALDLTLNVIYPSTRLGSLEVFPDLTPIDLKQCIVPGFGLIWDDRFPWIYHHEHEWLELDCDHSDGTHLRVFDPVLGWSRVSRARPQRWTTEAHGDSLTFQNREANERVFFDSKKARERRFPTNDAERATQALSARLAEEALH